MIPEPSSGHKPLWHRLLPSEQADWFARFLISLVAAGVYAGATLLLLALAEAALPPRTISYPSGGTGAMVTYTVSRISDELVAIALALAGVAWCLTLPWIWAGYARFRVALRTLFQFCAIWTLTIPVCVVIDSATRNEELWIAAVIVLASAATLLVLARAYAAARMGRPVLNASGEVDVRCPQCGYSLIGLGEARCPECGTQYTLDELIRLQAYSGTAQPRPAPPVLRSHTA